MPDKTIPGDAIEIARHPERHAQTPSLFLLAWCALKAERGQTVRQSRLPRLTPNRHREEREGAMTGPLASYRRYVIAQDRNLQPLRDARRLAERLTAGLQQLLRGNGK